MNLGFSTYDPLSASFGAMGEADMLPGVGGYNPATAKMTPAKKKKNWKGLLNKSKDVLEAASLMGQPVDITQGMGQRRGLL